VLEQIASFVAFFIYLLVLKSFFLPLFIIPTGSMAETLYGAHATHTCPNCGMEYPVGLPLRGPSDARVAAHIVQCPNCRWQEQIGPAHLMAELRRQGVPSDDPLHGSLRERAGDRIMVHGWLYELGGALAPQRWDVVVFKVPTDGQTNYIKRLIGKPGETIEIIDGDIFVTDPHTGETAIARKTPHAQHALWFSYYDHDSPPRRPAGATQYHPRWIALEDGNGWSGLDTRRPSFDGLEGGLGEIQFVTAPGATRAPGEIADVYGYNNSFPCVVEPASGRVRVHSPEHKIVTDLRLSCEIAIEAAGQGGFVEISTSKYSDRFFARLYAEADGRVSRVTLEHVRKGDSQRQIWGDRAFTPGLKGPLHVAMSNVDHVVSVEIDGQPVEGLRSTLAQYDITPDLARRQSQQKKPPRVAIAAHNVKASLAHLLIERDVFYTDSPLGREQRPVHATQGQPIVLNDNAYFVLGDNSPSSLDGRYSFAQSGQKCVGPHLADSDYQEGTVPADQLIGPAFLVYWPGTDALLPGRKLPRWLELLNQLPGPGRIRWIH
jgi:signal peptidase I